MMGVVNTLAGAGSFVTVPLLMAVGLSPADANATNRVGVLMQTGVATGLFARGKALHRASLLRYVGPLLVGSTVGAVTAARVADLVLGPVFGVLMLLMAVHLWRHPTDEGASGERHRHWVWAEPLAAFAIGVFGGFIQAGVGLMLTAAQVTISRLNATQATGGKNAMTFLLTVPALLVFVMHDQVRWVEGLLLGLGTTVGAVLGSRVGLLPGSRVVIVRFVVVVLVVVGVRLLVM